MIWKLCFLNPMLKNISSVTKCLAIRFLCALKDVRVHVLNLFPTDEPERKTMLPSSWIYLVKSGWTNGTNLLFGYCREVIYDVNWLLDVWSTLLYGNFLNKCTKKQSSPLDMWGNIKIQGRNRNIIPAKLKPFLKPLMGKITQFTVEQAT